MRIYKNHSLKKLNTFNIDIKADTFIEISSERDLQELQDRGIFNENFLILGGGSNILFTDDYRGTVIHPAFRGMAMSKITDEYIIMKCGAGENWHNFVETCVKSNYYGLENLALIPGNVGSAPVQNIGAYGTEQGDFIYSVKYWDVFDGRFVTLGSEECNFSYRNSIFKNELKGRAIITEVSYKLSKTEKLNLSYKELADEVNKFVVVIPDARYIFNAVCRIRKRKLPDHEILGNAGSFFKNPVVSSKEFEKIKSIIPGFKAFETNSGYKCSAARLIDHCGWKGRREIDAGVSEKHALILVNHGNASGMDIFNLSEKIINSVKEIFGVRLEREVNII